MGESEQPFLFLAFLALGMLGRLKSTNLPSLTPLETGCLASKCSAALSILQTRLPALEQAVESEQLIMVAMAAAVAVN